MRTGEPGRNTPSLPSTPHVSRYPPAAMSLPLIGSINARVVEAAEVSIHGDQYIDAVIEPEPALGAPSLAGSTIRIRIARHVCQGGRAPQAGDRIRAELLMGQITAVEVIGE